MRSLPFIPQPRYLLGGIPLPHFLPGAAQLDRGDSAVLACSLIQGDDCGIRFAVLGDDGPAAPMRRLHERRQFLPRFLHPLDAFRCHLTAPFHLCTVCTVYGALIQSAIVRPPITLPARRAITHGPPLSPVPCSLFPVHRSPFPAALHTRPGAYECSLVFYGRRPVMGKARYPLGIRANTLPAGIPETGTL